MGSYGRYYWWESLFLILTLVLRLGNSGPLLPTNDRNSKESLPMSQKNGQRIKQVVQPLKNSGGLVKRSAEDESEEQLQQTLPYTMIISKKSATVLNKLVTALRNSLDQNSVKNSEFLRDKELMPLRNSANYEMFNLQRRNQKDRKNYLRCYFNAVSCF